jgi:hypothetical protein
MTPLILITTLAPFEHHETASRTLSRIVAELQTYPHCLHERTPLGESTGWGNGTRLRLGSSSTPSLPANPPLGQVFGTTLLAAGCQPRGKESQRICGRGPKKGREPCQPYISFGSAWIRSLSRSLPRDLPSC